MSPSPYWDNSVNASGQIVGPGADGPLNAPMEWDTCQLQGIHLPGIVEFNVDSQSRRLQSKKQDGSDGSTPTFRGQNPAKGNLRITIWTPDQLTLMDSLLPIVYPNPNKDVNKLSALDVSHPVASQRRIKSIIITDVSGPSPGSVRGSKMYDLKWEQFVPIKAKSATKTVVGSVAVRPAFQNTTLANAPAPPSKTDFGPNVNANR